MTPQEIHLASLLMQDQVDLHELDRAYKAAAWSQLSPEEQRIRLGARAAADKVNAAASLRRSLSILRRAYSSYNRVNRKRFGDGPEYLLQIIETRRNVMTELFILEGRA